MPNAPTLLNDDGTASMATMFLMSHHAFRRDLRRFGAALRAADASRSAALRDEWQAFHAALHGHHEMEDTRIFPHMKAEVQRLAPTIDRLLADHRLIDPLLERGDRAFAGLPGTAADAAAVVAELTALLDTHLALEEAEVVPQLRGASGFPPPASDAEADLYAQGFAWSSQGVAPDVLEKVYALLPGALTSRLPAAREAFEARCARAWGRYQVGAARTVIPEVT